MSSNSSKWRAYSRQWAPVVKSRSTKVVQSSKKVQASPKQKEEEKAKEVTPPPPPPSTTAIDEAKQIESPSSSTKKELIKNESLSPQIVTVKKNPSLMQEAAADASLYDAYIGYDVYLNETNVAQLNSHRQPSDRDDEKEEEQPPIKQQQHNHHGAVDVDVDPNEAAIYTNACGAEIICSFHMDFIPKSVDLEKYFSPFGRIIEAIKFEKVSLQNKKGPAKGIPIARIQFDSYSAILKVQQAAKDGIKHKLPNLICFRVYASWEEFQNAYGKNRRNIKNSFKHTSFNNAHHPRHHNSNHHHPNNMNQQHRRRPTKMLRMVRVMK